MKQLIDTCSFTKIIETIPGAKWLKEGLALSDSSSPLELHKYPLFHHPFRLEGAAIFLHQEGCDKAVINLREYTLEKNQLLICAPGDIVQSISNSPVNTPRVLLLSHAFLQSMQIGLNNFVPTFILLKENPIFQLTPQELEELATYYKLMEENITQTGYYQLEVMQRLTALYLYKIGNILSRNQAVYEKQKRHTASRESIILNQFLQLVATHHTSERRVSFYAEKLFLSPKYFSALIKRASHTSASEWIDNYVIQEAKSLLKYSNLSIQEITYHLNFPNPSFFGKYFKQHTGISPKQYREV
ncbi:MAG: helix-turn-helix domain-containing protein [Phocaeicola sp.]